MKNKYQSSREVQYLCSYHVVWCPKYRRKVLTGTIAARLEELIANTCVSIEVDLKKLEVFPDHVELVISVIPQYGIHKAVKCLKACSSRALRQEFPELTTKLPTLWSNAYLITTVGEEPTDAIQAFIQSQKTSQRP